MSKLDRAALAGIRLYQRHISRHKGFCCAHAALHGGESCSAAVARIVREDGVRAGRARIAARFADCRAAYRTLQAAGPSPLAFGTGGAQVRGLCCCGPIPIPFKCGG